MKNVYAGAGLPWFENRCIKYVLIPLVRLCLGWNSSLYLFQKEVTRIKKLIQNIPEEQRCQRIKIERVFGIEEHSKDYSVNMTLEHLSIVTQAMVFVIDTLSKEQTIEKEIYIKDVKPTHNAKDEHVTFFKTMNSYIQYLQNHNKKPSKMTKKHPWFVEFNNEDWAVFTFIHMLVHRRQLESIVKRLNAK